MCCCWYQPPADDTATYAPPPAAKPYGAAGAPTRVVSLRCRTATRRCCRRQPQQRYSPCGQCSYARKRQMPSVVGSSAAKRLPAYAKTIAMPPRCRRCRMPNKTRGVPQACSGVRYAGASQNSQMNASMLKRHDVVAALQRFRCSNSESSQHKRA